jgi:hypothetical protein
MSKIVISIKCNAVEKLIGENLESGKRWKGKLI